MKLSKLELELTDRLSEFCGTVRSYLGNEADYPSEKSKWISDRLHEHEMIVRVLRKAGES